MHIYDARFPVKSAMVDGATAADYRGLQARLGTRRTVVVTPRACGTDNRVTLDAINQLGRERTRGVAVVNTTVSDAELASLDAGGIRGIRFTLYTQDNAPTTFGMVEPLAHRVHELGWHLQLHWTADQIVEHAALLRRLPCPLVFDHLARLPMPAGIGQPAFAFVRGLLQEGRAWLKLSGAYLDTAVGAAGNYADATAVARAWVAAAPRRLVWGSDWPHPTERSKPDDAQLMDLLPAWAEDEAAQRAILVDNPAALYGFDTP
jgi:predicted TIM-barrel fold metal-dependent hydrolase